MPLPLSETVPETFSVSLLVQLPFESRHIKAVAELYR
jgi:hypothetical protein